MKRLIALFAAIILMFSLVPLATPVVSLSAALNTNNIIPKPVSVAYGDGNFALTAASKIIVDVGVDIADEVVGVGEYLAGKMRASTGFDLPVVVGGTPTAADIVLKTIANTALLAEGVDYAKSKGNGAYGSEGYALVANASGLVLTAYEPEGLFRGIQTIRQLLPAEIAKDSLASDVAWEFQYISVVDYPRYGVRSIAMDPTRKYFPKEEIMRQIDIMVQYKLNTMHLHLSDDQGFRIAFEGYPELREFGGKTKLTYASAYTVAGILPSGTTARLAPGSMHYGVDPSSFSKADFMEILDYADARYVAIIPEIEIPTHAHSQQLSLPLLNGTTVPTTTSLGQMPTASLTGTQSFWTETVGQSVPADPTSTTKYGKYTAAFVKDIYTQLAEMLPARSNVIHLGGDEPNRSELTATIYNNMQRFAYQVVHDAGKQTMQWNATSRQNATSLTTLDIIQNWDTASSGAGSTPTINANPNAKVICSLANIYYLDHRTSTSFPVGGSWANSALAVSTMFNADPETAVASANRNRGYVIGIDGPLWSETYGTRQTLDMLTWPRAMCIAEVAWSPAETRSGTGATSAWANFQPRMAAQGWRMTYEGITFMNETTVWDGKTVTISSSITGTNTWATPGVTTPLNTPVSGKFTFSAPGSDTAAIKKCSEPSQGTVTLAADGSWTYTPNPGFIGKDSFTVGFQVDGYGIPLGPATSSGRGTVVWNAFRNVYINVTATGTFASKVTLLANSPTNARVEFDPPVPSLVSSNFAVNNGVTVRMAETFDNGSTYLLVTTPRDNGNNTYTLTVTRSGSNPAYTFNTVNLTSNALIPKPVSFTLDSASFIVKPETKFIAQASDAADLAAVKNVAEYLAAKLRVASGYSVPVVDSGAAGIRDITFRTVPKTQALASGVTYAIAGDEGYHVEIGVDGAVVTAYTPEGLFRGMSTVRQLLPAEVEKGKLAAGVDWVMTYCTIVDYPRYEFRALHIDPARHFRPKDELLRQIDLLSQYKINVVHLHLTDNQGWRIAFDGLPELTDFGGATKNVGGDSMAGCNPNTAVTAKGYPGSLNDGYAGYYTKQDYIDIVAYAAERYIEIMPEIEFPGHSLSQCFSLPEINGSVNGGINIYSGGMQGNGSSSNCVSVPSQNPFALKYAEEVIRQLAEMTPGRYIHTGGDEVPTGTMNSDAQNRHNGEIFDIVHANNKLTVQWIQDNANSYNYTSVPDVIENWKPSHQSWSFVRYSVQNGAKVIANLSDRTYFDHASSYYDMPFTATWARGGGGLPTAWAYQWDPEEATAAVSGSGANIQYTPTGYEDQIIGVAADTWSERFGSEAALDILVYPRIMCLAEVGWSPKEDRTVYATNTSTMPNYTKATWINFKDRMAQHGIRMTYEGINFMNDPNVWPTKAINAPTTVYGRPLTTATTTPAVSTLTEITTAVNTPVSGQIIFSAADPNDTAVSLIASVPSQGTVSLTEDGAWTYTPNPGFSGIDSFVASLSTPGYGIAWGRNPAATQNAGSAYLNFNGFVKVFITVNPAPDTVAVTVTQVSASKDNIVVKMVPPVRGLDANLTVNRCFSLNGVNVKYATTYDNGSTYVLITEKREYGTAYELTITKAGYEFNTLPITNRNGSFLSIYSLIKEFEGLNPRAYTFVTGVPFEEAMDAAKVAYNSDGDAGITAVIDKAAMDLLATRKALVPITFAPGSQPISVVIRKGMTYQLKIASNNPDTLFYISSNANATVNANGLVTAVKTGSAVITVIDSWTQQYFTVTINITS